MHSSHLHPGAGPAGAGAGGPAVTRGHDNKAQQSGADRVDKAAIVGWMLMLANKGQHEHSNVAALVDSQHCAKGPHVGGQLPRMSAQHLWR